MIEHTIATGSYGFLKIEDRTDDPDLMMVDVFAGSTAGGAIPQMPWTYSTNGVMENWKSFNFLDVTTWQKLGSIYAGVSQTFTLHLGNTGTIAMGGPTDLAIDLFSAPGGAVLIDVKIGGVYKKATPYVRANGVWQPAKPFVKTPSGWVETV